MVKNFEICPNDLALRVLEVCEFLNMVVGGTPGEVAGYLADLLEHALTTAWKGAVVWEVNWTRPPGLYHWPEQTRTAYYVRGLK